MSQGIFYLLHARSPVHMGTGAALGGIDLPHAREASTKLPIAPGSAIKGVLRDVLKADLDKHDPSAHERLFGSDWVASTNRDQGALMFSDALLACLAVPSYAGGWAWVTSPMCLRRLERELVVCGLGGLGEPVPDLAVDAAAAAAGSGLTVGGWVYLHDFRVRAEPSHQATADAVSARLASLLYDEQSDWRDIFRRQFLVVSDPVLDHLAQVAMDVRTRIALDDDSKTVRDGALWTEESLPPESVLWGSVGADPIQGRGKQRHSAASSLKALGQACGGQRRLQIGGKATVGRGVVALRLHGVPA